jgi:copper homeostasis protein
MRRDIEAAKALGAAGVVFGVLDDTRGVDRDRMAELTALSRPLSVTFHKAIDQARDTLEALDCLIAMGVDRVLTSGARPTAFEGVETLRSMVERSGGRLAVMAGGGLRIEHLEDLIRGCGVCEIHLGSAVSGTPPHPASGSPSFASDGSYQRTDAQRVKAIVDSVRDTSLEHGV